MAIIEKTPVSSIYDKHLHELMGIKAKKANINLSSKDLVSREKMLKAEVADYVKKNGPIIYPEGRIEYKYNCVKRTLQRAKTLDYISKNFGEEMANDVDENCTVVNESEGVWTYRKKIEDLSEDASEVAIPVEKNNKN